MTLIKTCEQNYLWCLLTKEFLADDCPLGDAKKIFKEALAIYATCDRERFNDYIESVAAEPIDCKDLYDRIDAFGDGVFEHNIEDV